MTTARLFYLPVIEDAALDPVFADWRRAAPEGGVLALVAEADHAVVPLLQAAARRAGLPLAGAVFPALLREGDFARNGAYLFRLDAQPRWALVQAQADATATAAAVAEAVTPMLAAAPATLMLLFDAMLPDIASTLDALYLHLADRVRYMGANAGSETFQPMPCLFDAERTTSDAVLCLLLPDDRGAALEHGYLPPEDMVCATATEGNRIVSIDWRPAFEVYRERVLAHYEVRLTPENFYRYGVHFPLACNWRMETCWCEFRSRWRRTVPCSASAKCRPTPC